MDVAVDNGGTFQLPFPEHWNAFAYVIDGSGTIGKTPATPQHALVLEHGSFVEATSTNSTVRTL